MTTARKIIESSLRKIHVLGKGQELDPDEANDALETLNNILSVWSAEGDFIFTETKESFPLDGSESYTIGSGATFDTERPNYIQSAFITIGSTSFPLTQIDAQQYSRITEKNIVAIPDRFHYDAGFPVAKLYLYPIGPSGHTLNIYSFKPLEKFSSLDAVVSMPPEYKAALEFNLSIWIAPEYERQPSMHVEKLARHTKSVVSSQNKRNENFVSTIDLPTRNYRGNIYEGLLS